MKTIIKKFSDHGTFVQQESIDYILSKENPKEFISYLTKNLKEFPLVLTIEHIREIEDLSKIKDNPKTEEDSYELKQIKTKMISEIYSGNIKPQITDDTELEFDDPDKSDQINLPENSSVEELPKVIDIKKLKGWKPKAKEYDSEINIIKDVTGNSICEGTTDDFTKLFLDRFGSLRKILRNQRRELAHVLPIKRIKTNGLKEIQFVGIVKEVRTTTNGHRLIEIEDDTDTATCIALKNQRDLLQMANEVVLDEIVLSICISPALPFILAVE